jgi:hypothetical protein
MTDLPSLISTVLVAANVLLIATAAALLVVGVWAIRGDLNRDVRSRYSWRTILMSQLPFTEGWRSAIAPTDLAAFVRYRRRHLAFLSVIVLSVWSITAYGYLQGVAALYRCHMSMLDQVPQKKHPTARPR